MNVTREEYLAYRKTKQLPIEMVYDFYTEKCEENPVPLDKFIQYFQQQGIPKPVNTHFGNTHMLVPINVSAALAATMNHFDIKFGITSIIDKKGEVIKWL